MPDNVVRYERKTVIKCDKAIEVLSDMKATWNAKDFSPACKLDLRGSRTEWAGVIQSTSDESCGFFYPGHLISLDNKEMRLDPHEYMKCF